MSQDESNAVEHEGELFSSTWRVVWIETGSEIAPGNAIVPIPLPASAKTVEYSALHLAADDLRLSRDSFTEAAKFGLPSDANSLSKALIYAGVMSYARSFAGGVRGFRLTVEFFVNIWNDADSELHEYLYALRDKHVAHSVNNFERATTVGVVVTDPTLLLLGTNPSGIGVTKLSMVGLPMSKLKACPDHIARMISRIDERISELGQDIHAEMRALLKMGERVQLAPMVTLPDRSKIGERRR